MNSRRPNQRKRVRQDSEPQNVTKKKPRHTVFLDSDDEEQAEANKGEAGLAGKRSCLFFSGKQTPIGFSDARNNDSGSYHNYKVAPQNLRDQERLQTNRKPVERFTQNPHNSVQNHSKHQPKSVFTQSATFSCSCFDKKDDFWDYLSIRGPYHNVFPRLCDSTVRNRPLCKIIRCLLKKVHQNAIQYRDNDIPNLARRFNYTKTPTVEDAVSIAEEMCQNVFRFVDDDGLSIDLYEDNMISPLGNLFFAKDFEVYFTNKTEILQRLKLICDAKSVNATSEELEDVRNAIALHAFVFAKTLFSQVFSTDVHKFPGRIAFRPEANNVMEPYMRYCKPTRFKNLPRPALCRSQPSLWKIIPREDGDHLLEAVLSYGLIQLLPAEAKSFLDHWLVDVRKRTKSMLRKENLRKIKEFMAGSSRNEKMPPDDVRVETIISSVLDSVLNTEDFLVFDGEWKYGVMNWIKAMRKHSFSLNMTHKQRFEDLSNKLDPVSLARLSSFFPDSWKYRALISNCLQQILHFVLRFALSTIHQIFRVENFMFTLDVLDDETMDFESVSKEVNSESDQKESHGKGFVKNKPSFSSSFATQPASSVQRTSPLTSAYPVRHPVTGFPEGFSSGAPPPNMWAGQNQAMFMPNYPNNSYPAPSQPFNSSYPQQRFEEPPINSINVPLEEPPAKRPRTESFNNSTISKGTEGEINRARALRPSSVIRAPRNIFEGIPEKWVVISRAEVEKKEKLTAELRRSKERLDTLLSKVD